MVDDAFGHWLAGFVDGEGCFAIIPSSTGHGLRCVFRLALRADDKAILDDIHGRVALGTITRKPLSVKGGSPQVVWTATSKADCLGLVHFFDRYPLRAKKARDFAIWREAVLRWQGAGRGRRGPTGFDWSGIAALREQLVAVREYGSTPDLEMPESQQLHLVADRVYTHALQRSYDAMREAVGKCC